MATQSKTPSTPAKRGKKTANLDASSAAPVKARAQRSGGAAEQQSAPAPEAAIQEQTFEAPRENPSPAEPKPAATFGSGSEDRASRALDAIKTLGEMIAEGIGTLAELRAEVRQMSGRLDQLAASRPNADEAKPDSMTDAADDYQMARDHDPGDAVPPGVAVVSPTPLTETDKAALHSLEELPKRVAKGKRSPRAKA